MSLDYKTQYLFYSVTAEYNTLGPHAKYVQEWLDRGADVNAKGQYGYTPLKLLVTEKFKFPKHPDKQIAEAAKVLLDYGADVDARDNIGFTPLMSAAANGYVETPKLLLERGADVNAKNQYGLTPLMWAAFRGTPETVELLLENGADIHAKTNDHSFTALHMASDAKSKKLLKTWQETTDVIETVLKADRLPNGHLTEDSKKSLKEIREKNPQTWAVAHRTTFKRIFPNHIKGTIPGSTQFLHSQSSLRLDL